MEDFYKGEINNHVKTAWNNYVTGVNDFLKISSWYKAIKKWATFINPSPTKFLKRKSNPAI